MDTEKERSEILEIYKLHANIANSMKQGRETTRRLFFGLVAGLFAFLANALKENVTPDQFKFVLATGAGAGAIFCIFWFSYMRYYNWSYEAKRRSLLELDKQLAYPFLKREAEYLAEVERKWVRFKKQSVDILPPALFLFLFGGLLIVAFRS